MWTLDTNICSYILRKHSSRVIAHFDGLETRDVFLSALVAAVLGTGPAADAYLAAFRFPNLFRRWFGEGAFNGALTARIGTAAIDVTRPAPFLDTDPIRVRDLLPELLRRTPKA